VEVKLNKGVSRKGRVSAGGFHKKEKFTSTPWKKKQKSGKTEITPLKTSTAQRFSRWR